MIYGLILISMLFCGIQAVRAAHLMNAALWLAGVSALLAVLLYGLSAYEVAVIELSVGAGLVTVLFVFAINLSGDESLPARTVVPKPLAFALVIAFALLLILFAQPLISSERTPSTASFTETFWHERSADALAQIVLIFTGALSVLGLLTERHAKSKRVFTPRQEAALREEQRL
jgi:uncharacterized MnhB-related membrane protein